MVRGRHTLVSASIIATGYRSAISRRTFLEATPFNNTLVFTNGGGGANNCPTVTCGTGNPVADFLLGYYDGASTFQPGPLSTTGSVPGNLNQYHFKYLAPYFQDDWKATERLTLNLGIRWDYRSVPFEQSNKMFWIDDQNTLGGLCFADQTLLTDGIAPAGNGFYRYCGRRNPRDGSKILSHHVSDSRTVLSSWGAAIKP